MYKTIKPYEDIIKIIDSVDIRADNEGTEMDDTELAFLCALIMEKRPKKILELGVAAGGTTTIILKCIEEFGFDTQVISIDKADKYYIDKEKDVGYLVEKNKENLGAFKQWHLYHGGGAEKFIDEISREGNIDFCILDTAHQMPGEVLDFLICYPYLTDHAIVIVHDLLLNHFGNPWNISPKILFDTVVAEKYLMWDKYEPAGYPSMFPNIGAFEITPDTRKNIKDVLSSLTQEWKYKLSECEIQEIRCLFRKHYDREFCCTFEEILTLQTKLWASKPIKMHMGSNGGFQSLLKEWKTSHQIVLYGCGNICMKYLSFSRAFGLRVDAIVVSDEMPVPKDVSADFHICHFSQLNQKEKFNYIVCIMDGSERKKIETELVSRGFKVINPA